MEVGKIINSISIRLKRRSHKVQGKLGIGSTQGSILSYILVESCNRSIYQKDIENEFGLRSSTVTEILKSLEKKELIKRIPSEKDARFKEIVFMPKALAIKSALENEITHTESVLTKGLSSNEINEFMRIGNIMLSNLESDSCK